jgi:hypothetical protein
MNLLSHLPWRRPSVRSARPTAADIDVLRYMDAADAVVDKAEGDGPAGCGWFASSHELQQGLLVTEHASADAVSAELPLQAWLELHLAGWQPPRRGVQ